MIGWLRQAALTLVLVVLTLGGGNWPSDAAAAEGEPSTERILSIFEEISRIPRCSKHEDRISAWLVEWARLRNLLVKTDDFRNVLITVPASKGYEHRPTVVLQAHMDMVCQKTDASSHDFSRDPIVPVRDGPWLLARDTTLGADDGIGVAVALALVEAAAKPHPALELLFTTDEEIDTTGAAGMSKGFFTGKKVINLDSETEGVVTLGSAGGIKLDIAMPLTVSPRPEGDAIWSLRVDGLLGGHSGLEIAKNRANAVVLLAQALSQVTPFRLIRFDGGTADNAIPRSAEAQFVLPADRAEELKAKIAGFEQETRTRYPDESSLSIALAPVEAQINDAASEADSAKLVELIMSIPQGVYEWSTQFAGLPQTSNNIGIVKTDRGALSITAFARSFDPEALERIAGVIEAASKNAGAVSARRSSLPPWPPKSNSDLYRKSMETYERLFKEPLKTEVVHAGLECGYFVKGDDMEIISIGPTLENVHTPRERLYVPSLERISGFLGELLGQL